MNERLPFVFATHTGSPTGYAEVATLCFRSLLELGVEVHYLTSSEDYIYETPTYDLIVNAMRKIEPERHLPWISLCPGPAFWQNGGDYKIGWTMIEVDHINERWVRACNSMDEIWVPTPSQVDVFRESGVKKPIYFVPLGIDTTRFRPDFLPFVYHGEAKFRFFAMGWWQHRKRWDLLTRAFAREFGGQKEVGILYKTMYNGPEGEAAEQVQGWTGDKFGEQIAIMEGAMPWWEVVMTMRACHAFVLPTSGEGWGCPPAQALACGLPVIVTDCQGPAEVLRDNTGKPYPGVHFIPTRKEVTTQTHEYYKGENWWVAEIDDIRMAMRLVYEDYPHWKEQALIGSEMIRRERSGLVMAQAVRDRLTQLYQEHGFEPPATIPPSPPRAGSPAPVPGAGS